MHDTALGLDRRSVRLVAHDPRWAALFTQAAAELRQCLGDRLITIEHIGSTAVPNLTAKPVLDILIGVPSLQAPTSFHIDLERIGYQHRSMDTVPERLFFARGLEHWRTHNLSVCEANSTFWRDRIRFRDLLRSDPELCVRYAALKRELAVRFPNDRLSYTDAKGEFIAEALSR